MRMVNMPPSILPLSLIVLVFCEPSNACKLTSGVKRSSQLKHKPLVQRSCISDGVSRWMFGGRGLIKFIEGFGGMFGVVGGVRRKSCAGGLLTSTVRSSKSLANPIAADTETNGMQQLKLLALDKLEALERITVEEGAMPRLEKLIIQRCNFLQRVPTGIEQLTNLKVLEFFDMPDEFIVKLRPDKFGEDFCKVAHIPEVYDTRWRNDGWESYPLDGDYKNETSSTPKNAIRSSGRRNWL